MLFPRLPDQHQHHCQGEEQEQALIIHGGVRGLSESENVWREGPDRNRRGATAGSAAVDAAPAIARARCHESLSTPGRNANSLGKSGRIVPARDSAGSGNRE